MQTDGDRRLREDPTVRRLSQTEGRTLERAFAGYLDTIPPSPRFDRSLFFDIRDLAGKSGFGIGSARACA